MTFPYRRYFLPPADEMFASLQRLGTGETSFNVNGDKLIRSYPEDYHATDAISCHFTEDVRMKCRALGRSPYQVWQSLNLPPVDYASNPAQARINNEKVYQAGIKEKSTECSLFNAGLAVYLYTKFLDQVSKIRILDPSSGWGDRLLAALCLREFITAYHGFDPNLALQAAYRAIIERYGKGVDASVQPIPFEDAAIPPRSYDIAMTSPPYDDLETYVETCDDVACTQAKTRYRDFESFMRKFYIPYMALMAHSVRVGGIVIVYVSNFTKDGNVIDMETPTISALEDAGARFLKKGLYGKDRPFFVFTIPPPPVLRSSLLVQGQLALVKPHPSEIRYLLAIVQQPSNVKAQGHSRSEDDIKQMVAYSQSHPDDLFWTILIGGIVRGYIGFTLIDPKKPPLFSSLIPTPINGHVLEVYLSENIQGQGWFHRIMEMIVWKVKLSSIWASTYEWNVNAQSSFRKFGMKEIVRGTVCSQQVVVFHR